GGVAPVPGWVRAPDYPPMSASAFASSACAARSSTRTSDHIVYCKAISRRFLAACTRSRRARTSSEKTLKVGAPLVGADIGSSRFSFVIGLASDYWVEG